MSPLRPAECSENGTDRDFRTKLAAITIAGIIVLGSVPLPVAAQGGGDTILLDQTREAVDSVRVDGNTYRIYEYTNLLPYANRIEVYRNGHRVTTKAEVRTAMRFVAWQRASEQLDSSDIETLEAINQRVAAINDGITPTLQLLERALAVIREMKERQVAGISLWDAATRASPSLMQFENSIRGLRDELREWKSAADAVNNNIPAIVNQLQQLENGGDVDLDELSNRFATSMAAMERLQQKSEAVADGLSTGSQTSAQIAQEIRGVPAVGGDLSSFFAGVSDQFATSAEDVRSFSDVLRQQRSNLQSVQSTARNQEKQLMNQWQNRESAKMKAFGTVGGVGMILGLLTLRRLW